MTMKFIKLLFYYSILTSCILYSQQTSQPSKLISHFGDGIHKAVYLENNMAYLVAGTNIKIIDYSDPIKPDTINQIKFTCSINNLYLENDTLYVIGDSLFIVDCTDLYTPKVLMKKNIRGFKVKKYDDLVIVLNNDGITTVNVSDIFNIELLGEISIFYDKYNFEYDGKYIYVAHTGGIFKIDAQNYGDLKLNYFLNVSGIYDISIKDNYLYATQNNKFLVFDIQASDSLVLSSSIDIYHGMDKIFLKNNIAFVSNRSLGLYTIDISNPTNPVEVGGYSTSNITDIFIDDNGIGWLLHSRYSYPTPTEILNVSSIWPKKINVINTLPYFAKIINYNNYIITSFLYNNKMMVIDFNDYNDPKIVHTFYSEEIITSMSINNNYLYLLTNTGIGIYDLNQINKLSKISQLTFDKKCIEVVFHNNYCFLSVSNGIKILDIADINNPQVIGTYETNHKYAGYIAISNSYLFLSVVMDNYGVMGFEVIDISNFTNPIKVGEYNLGTSSEYGDLVVDYPNVFVYGNSYRNLVICDVTDPTNITITQRYNFPNNNYPEAPFLLEGNTAYCNLREKGILALDLTDHNNISVIKEYGFPGGQSLLVDEKNIYFVNKSNGIYILEKESLTSASDINIVNESFLSQNYPNPFNPTTKINYSVKNSGNTQIKLFDILGREIKVLLDEYKTPGTYTLEFFADDLTSGVYYYRIISNNFTLTKKMILLK